MLLRRTALRPAPVPIAIEIDADVLVFPFLDRATYPREIESAYDRFHLTVVDPSWRALVPESLQYRMGASPP